MTVPDRRNLVPDNHLLAEIFPKTRSVRFETITHDLDSCTFTAHLEDSNEKFLVRIEAEGSHMPAVSAIQNVARLALPDLVPCVHKTGTSSTEDGRRLGYSVTTYIDHAVTLESIWDDLADDQQSFLMRQITYAVEKLQSIDLLSSRAQEILRSGIHILPENPAVPLGGPRMGFFFNASDLVRALVAYEDRLDLVTVTSTNDGGVIVETPFNDIPSVHIARKSLLEIQEAVVLCHNDLEPRNILVRAEDHIPTNNIHAIRYRVVGMIDWKMAGCLPFAFESFHKDLVLGSSNLHFPWYRLFKDQTAQFIPTNPLPEPQEFLMRALNVVRQARDRALTNDVGQRFQRKWIEREQLVRSEDISSGWVRSSVAGEVRRFSKQDNRELELSILRELGHVGQPVVIFSRMKCLPRHLR